MELSAQSGQSAPQQAQPALPCEDAADVATMPISKIIRLAYAQEKARMDEEKARRAVCALGPFHTCAPVS